jgi:hypothetical protein
MTKPVDELSHLELGDPHVELGDLGPLVLERR